MFAQLRSTMYEATPFQHYLLPRVRYYLYCSIFTDSTTFCWTTAGACAIRPPSKSWAIQHAFPREWRLSSRRSTILASSLACTQMLVRRHATSRSPAAFHFTRRFVSACVYVCVCVCCGKRKKKCKNRGKMKRKSLFVSGLKIPFLSRSAIWFHLNSTTTHRTP